MIVAALLLSLAAAVQAGDTPGRALFWSSGRGAAQAVYRSQSSSFTDVHDTLRDEEVSKDLVVAFCSEHEETNEFFATPHFAASLQGSEHAVVMPHIYAPRDSPGASLCAHATEATSSQVVTVDEMLTALSAPAPSAQRRFIIPLAPATHASAHYDELLAQLHQKNALIVGLQSPEMAAPATRGHYTRLLQDSQDENYNPEGTEFTIYYQNTYLYLTPDLFTGLMTFLFCTFVLLTGFSCLNQIQGPATFVHVMPTLGKEG